MTLRIVLALLLLLSIAQQAHAIDPDYVASPACGINANCDQGVAYREANKIKANREAQRDQLAAQGFGQSGYMSVCGLSQPNYSWTIPPIGGPLTNTSNNGFRDYVVYCPNGTTKAVIVTYAQASTCSARGALRNQNANGLGNGPEWPPETLCVNGCQALFRHHVAIPKTATQGWSAAGKLDYAAPNAVCATSDVATVEDKPNEEQCLTSGNLTQCYNPNTNQQCAVASTGKKFCWGPGETGPKVAADVTQAASKKETPYTPDPPSAPASDREWSTTQSGTSQSSTTNNGVTSTTTHTTNVYNNVPLGTGNGTGTIDGGTIDGGGNGSGEGQCTGVGSDCTGAGNAVAEFGDGELYEGDDTDVSDVVSVYADAVMQTPILAATANFFVVNVSGTCPAMEVEETDYYEAMEFTGHCSGPLADALALAGFLMLAVAAYTAFKIGFG